MSKKIENTQTERTLSINDLSPELKAELESLQTKGGASPKAMTPSQYEERTSELLAQYKACKAKGELSTQTGRKLRRQLRSMGISLSGKAVKTLKQILVSDES